jgi:hypothetical protein
LNTDLSTCKSGSSHGPEVLLAPSFQCNDAPRIVGNFKTLHIYATKIHRKVPDNLEREGLRGVVSIAFAECRKRDVLRPSVIECVVPMISALLFMVTWQYAKFRAFDQSQVIPDQKNEHQALNGLTPCNNHLAGLRQFAWAWKLAENIQSLELLWFVEMGTNQYDPGGKGLPLHLAVAFFDGRNFVLIWN